MNSKIININKKSYSVLESEFNLVPHNEFNNLQILSSLGYFERIIGLLKELTLIKNFSNSFLVINHLNHGGFIPLNCYDKFDNIFIKSDNTLQENNFLRNKNILEENTNLFLFHNFKKLENLFETKQNKKIFYYNSFDTNQILPNEFLEQFSIIIYENFNKNNEQLLYFNENIYNSYDLSKCMDYNVKIFIKKNNIKDFLQEFHFFIKNDNLLDFDNLLHLTMIVKNAGDQFRDILINNLNYFDYWTILDTGSTDNTINIINDVLVNKKKGKLYQEPFINFRDSRNRCLDLAAKNCKFIIMLDDTYMIKQQLKEFLTVVRGDQFSDSFSLYIQSNDTEYGSNRIIKSQSNLRYKYKLHEVIDPKNNVNVIIPIHHGHIFDFRCDYMEKRTMDRKQYDIKILKEMVEEEPNDSRALYYLGQTYNLLEEHELALTYFLKRLEHDDEGFLQEKIDACFEAARICNFKLNKPWEECLKLYERAYEMDKSRPDSIYFIGIHHYLQNDYKKAYEYMKLGYEIGYPVHCQYSLKPTLSFYFLPKFLTELCFRLCNFKLGEEVSNFFLKNNPEKENEIEYYTVKCWNKIFKHINNYNKITSYSINENNKKKLVFHVDGGFSTWTGKDILKKGIGGSETFIIEMAKFIQENGVYDVFVFCNCENPETFNNVHYDKLYNFSEFAKNNIIDYCIVSRYPEYLPALYNCINIKNVYLILHDMIPNGEIIIDDKKLQKILLLSNFHKNFFDQMFSTLKYKTDVFGYGIDTNLFQFKENVDKKIPLKFVYSSFPHRGLLQLLQIWEEIINKYPIASLHIHCDINNKWVNSVCEKEMKEVKKLLATYLQNFKKYNVTYHGWTSKEKLAETFKSAEFLLYPTNFVETFCLTALESAISKTFILTSKLGSLNDTVNDRGILIDIEKFGKNYEKTYQEEILKQLFYYIENVQERNIFIEKNYQWASNLSWKDKSKEFINLL
jgi:hypothetical protein